MDKSIAEIAGKLTEAERIAVRSLSRKHRRPYANEVGVRDSLLKLGLISTCSPAYEFTTYALTETGLALRNYLNGE
tara:strand:- start:2576 stop:2803 length:228 start_codon:yes stop_codon:yes gene_type:complete